MERLRWREFDGESLMERVRWRELEERVRGRE